MVLCCLFWFDLRFGLLSGHLFGNSYSLGNRVNLMYVLHHENKSVYITKTSPCNEDPLTPHFYIVKVGFTGVYIYFLFLL